MEDYAGRILADRYRLPLPPSDEYELIETRAFDTRSGQEVLVRQVPLPEVVDAELLDGTYGAQSARGHREGELPAVRRAIAAAQAAASVPDHARLDQVFDVFAEGGSLWIVSELVSARPLAALIAEEPLSPYRAAEVASDVLTALRVLHAHGWTHRNITVRTVLICDDGRVVLTGLAAGAAEEALCGYDPVPRPDAEDAAEPGTGWGAPRPEPDSPYARPESGSGYELEPGPGHVPGVPGYLLAPEAPEPGPSQAPEPGPGYVPDSPEPGAGYEPERPVPGSGYAAQSPAPGPSYAPLVAPGYDTGPRYTDHITPQRAQPPQDGADLQAAARAGTIAAYRAGARAAAAKVAEERGAAEFPGGLPPVRPTGANLPQGYAYPYGGPDGAAATPWHGATPRRRPATAPGEEPAHPEPGHPEPGRQEPGRQEPAHLELAPPEPPHPDPQAPADEPARPALPAQLALPQGYRQADSPNAPARPGPALDPARQRPGATGTDAPGGPDAPGTGRPGAHAPGAPAIGLPGARVPGTPAPGHPRTPAFGAAPGAAVARTGGPGAGLPGGSGGQVRPEGVAAPGRAPGSGGWGGGGPRSGLDAERARQTRMAVVGAVTERWAPEQAGPVHGHWQLAAPVGPATDLWALGALLYRAVQGHAPYPEDSVAELVEMVCAEAPAFAEECGPLRPVVESLLRQDPTERPDFEELRGWLRSLVRSAPEPDGDLGVLPMPEADPARLPVPRRRGELHGRHRNPAAPRKPRALGRTLLVGILAVLAGAVAYAMLFMPRSGDPQAGGQEPTAAQSPKPSAPAPSQPAASQPAPGRTPSGTPESKPAGQTDPPAPQGYTVQQDPAHFSIAVPDGWERQTINEAGQVRYVQGQFTLIVVPGRDPVEGRDPDPVGYQKDKEPELAPYRNSTWASGGDVKSTKVGQQLRVTGRYTWIDAAGRSLFARNFVVALGGKYHIVMVTGPEDNQDKVADVFDKATASYRSGG
ncbi:serine/threonine protein kinase [Streptomyces sp. NPDC006512]|uniref:serine/threonine protein kinase n=1 Tax=Streptomyces sp. NPDC006512 TaxID=3154307 RepID=UPI0033B18DCD